MSDSPERPDREPNKDARRNGRPNVPKAGMQFGKGVFGWVLFVLLAIMLFLYVSNSGNGNTEVPINAFLTQLDSGNIKSVSLEPDGMTGELFTAATAEGKKYTRYHVNVTQMMTSDWNFVSMLNQKLEAARAKDAGKGITLKAEGQSNPWLMVIIPFIPWLLIFAFIWFFVFRQLKNSGGAGGMLGNFGRSRHKITNKEHTNVTFNDVAGVQEAKDEVMEIVEFLKNPKKFQRLGGRIPRGVLLVGEPGTGKTLLAKAIAGEADVPFFSISGSDFVEMFVGVGASRVRDLFKQAKDNSPCIIFLDEIDAVGRRRGSGFSSGGHDEREQTLNAILVEMDGFDSNDQVIVVASTNRVDVLDPALTRPGRFDRQVSVPLPDVKGRLEILKVHSRKVKLGPDSDLARLARATSGFSGADLAATINEAALGATLANKDFIETEDLEEARDKVRWGRARKSAVIDERDKLATAYHEAGHAIVQYLEKDADPIHKVTIIPRGQSLGSTMTLPERDATNHSRRWCMSWIRMGMAGRIAEEMFTGDINTGAFGDIRQVTSIARKMVRDWGMNDRVGFVFYGEDNSRPGAEFGAARDYSEATAKAIDEEVKKLIDGSQDETRLILEKYRDRVEAVAKALLKYETLDAQDIDRIMKGDNLTRPTVSDMTPPPSASPRPVTIQPAVDNAEPDINLGGTMPQPG